ncbi:MAG: hypothetical protein ACOCP3_01420 [Halodesulfurarchaeum sp.]
MFTFEADQEIYEVNGTKIGGQPGETPTLMVGSIFYKGDPVLEDPKTGEFDEEAAEEAVKNIMELSEKTGNPAAFDTIGDSPEALKKHIEFMADVTDAPIFMDGPTPSIRSEAAKFAGEIGIEDQLIYNSIESSTKQVDEEIEAIQESGIDSAVLLSIDTTDMSIDGRRNALDENLEVADEAGLSQPIVDPGIIDIPDSGYVAKIIYELKDEYGIPMGCAPHNEVIQWEMNDPLVENSRQLRQAVANSVIVHLGADFNIYGPVHGAAEMYEVMSTADAYVAYGAQMGEGRRADTDHPLFKIFR